MINLDYNTVLDIVKSRMSQKRFTHTMAVVKLSVELAQVYGENSESAMWSALVHDITKEMDKNEQLQIIKKSDIMTDKVFLQNNRLFHGLTAYLFARDELKIDDQDILNAVRYHSTGRENMSMLEKIVYLSDSCSYERKYAAAEDIRNLAFKDIDTALLSVLEFTISTVIKRREVIAVDTINAYNDLIALKISAK